MNTTTYYLIDAAGWTGAALVLLAYGLISTQWLEGHSFSYQALNMAGAFLLVVNSYYLGAYPSVGVNAAWIGIALLTLLRDWWRGPVKALSKVSAKFPKRVHLRKVTLQRIKLPTIHRSGQKSSHGQSAANGIV